MAAVDDLHQATGHDLNLVVGDKHRDEIVDYLWWLETEQIGMPGDREGVERFADRLLKLDTRKNPSRLRP